MIFYLQDLKKHIENHMNPSKTKKQSSRSGQEAKPETTYFQPYMHPTQFNQSGIPNQQMIQVTQAIQN